MGCVVDNMGTSQYGMGTRGQHMSWKGVVGCSRGERGYKLGS